MTLPLLTSSRLKDARACQRLHKLRYFDGYVPLEDAAPLRFGTMIHVALEAWWSEETEQSGLASACATIPDDVDPFEAAMARALLIGYDTRWSGQRYEVLAVEQEFRVPLINPETGSRSKTWELAGKLDALAVDNGRTVFVEHKTSGSDITPGSEYWKRLRLDGQVSIYFAGAKALGYDVEACIYDVIGKPKLRPYKATPEAERKYTKAGTLYANQREQDETPEEYEARLLEAIAAEPHRYFARGEIVRLEAEVEDAAFDVWQLGKQIREGELAGRFPKNVDACVRFGRTCPFLPVCCGEASLDDERLFRKVDNVHPELSAADAG